MITKEQRLERIKNARSIIERDRLSQVAKNIETLAAFEMKVIEKYGAKIKDLIDLAWELNNQGFSIGEYNDRECETQFESNGITHRFGFVCKGSSGYRFRSLKAILGIGFKAGGVCGDQNFVLNEDGFVSFSSYFFEGRELNKSFEKFECYFKEFEEAFYKYIDNLK
jgi:hypothetical protein